MSHIGNNPIKHLPSKKTFTIFDKHGKPLHWIQEGMALLLPANKGHTLKTDSPDSTIVPIQSKITFKAYPKQAFQICHNKESLTVIDTTQAILSLKSDKAHNPTNRKVRANEKQKAQLWGTTQRLVSQAIMGESLDKGITIFFNGLGFKASIQQDRLILKLGYSHNICLVIPESVRVSFPQDRNKSDGNQGLMLKGPNKSDVHKFADLIRTFRPPECYKGKGVLWNTKKAKQQLTFSRKVGKKKS